MCAFVSNVAREARLFAVASTRLVGQVHLLRDPDERDFFITVSPVGFVHASQITIRQEGKIRIGGFALVDQCETGNTAESIATLRE